MAGYIDFFLIDGSDPADKVLALERLLSVGEGSVASVIDLVSVVSAKCQASHAKVGVLRLSGHGNETGGPIGKDWIDLTTLPRHATDLAKLNRYFEPARTQVVFDACQTGTNIRLLSKLSELWQGVPVSGFFDNQNPNFFSPADEGVKFTCILKSCLASHPDIPAAMSRVQLR